MKKITAILMGLASLFAAQSWAESFAVKSPNGKLEAVVNDGDKLTLSVKADGKTIFDAFQYRHENRQGRSWQKRKGARLGNNVG